MGEDLDVRSDQPLTDFEALHREVRACRICAEVLPHTPRPVLQVHPDARILIAGQAPGRRVHESGIPFQDPSGDRLRDWLGVDETTFYDPQQVAILPMGFCFPGTGRSGDKPPRPECAPAWRESLLASLKRVELTLVLGRHALDYHLPAKPRTVTEAAAAWRDRWPEIVALPHPSPRNQRWLKKNPWFERDLIPRLRQRVSEVLA